jgi:2-oxoglutarate dehydrogenase E2 component (dihydrolipoamide succinyltransferase)
MIIEIKIPSPGESVMEVEIANWLVNDGDFVEKDQEIAEVESDKATLPLLAEESGTITILKETGKTIEVGAVACTINTGETAAGAEKTGKAPAGSEDEAGQAAVSPGKTTKREQTREVTRKAAPVEDAKETAEAKDAPLSGPGEQTEDAAPEKIKISPLAKKMMAEENLSVDDIISGLRRISKEDVSAVAKLRDNQLSSFQPDGEISRETTRRRMSLLRRKLSQRLVSVKNETAMLTTFNEVDMSKIIAIRKEFQSRFVEKHGVKLGFISFFTKAVTETLKTYPGINSYIDGEEIVTPGYYDIGIAVQTEKGLMVPVVRNTETLSLAGIEKKVIELAEKARKNRISIEEMTGGTFTITNGGIFGSLLSTPILNPPQSGILGMHNIVERPVALNGQVVIRPMMYTALSYDHRIIDGRESVSFLVHLKELLENPARMIMGGKDPDDLLLDL